VAKRFHLRRYARAVFEIALEKKELDRWQSDLSKMASLVKDADIMQMLENPKIKFEDKARLLSESLTDINPLALNLLYLLITRGGLGILGGITSEYQRLFDSYRGIEQAEVITAVPLMDKEKQTLERQLEAVVGKDVALKPEVDPSLLGGIVVKIGGKLLDGSTRSRLSDLKRELVGGGR